MPTWIEAIDALPRFPLLEGPSPLQRLSRLSEALGGRAEIWIKREDLLPLAFGGNKLRNLEFLVGQALAEGADSVVTSGRRWSNHCRLTAAAGARAGLDVHLVLSGPPRPLEGANERIERLLGATVHGAATAERTDREALVDAVAEKLRAQGRRPFVIGVGGSGVSGAAGQLLAGRELVEQARAAAAEPDVVVVPSATGGTQAGLIAGLRLVDCQARVQGVAVAQPPDELRPKIEHLLAGLGELVVRDLAEPVHLDDAFLAPGYGRRNAAADEATERLARTEGLLVDPIYTAKALAWLIEAARRGELDGRRVVFWHAGGTPGLFEALDEDA
jgi:1-aminocyclopropane-1-carboxylate deaminase/D-cysteine desulfhydrase-like pyridoxal-dependent ACC family enzyme